MRNGVRVGLREAAVAALVASASACPAVAGAVRATACESDEAMFVVADPENAAGLTLDAGGSFAFGPAPAPIDWTDVPNRVTATRERAPLSPDSIVVVLSKARLYHFHRGAIAAEYPVAYGFKTRRGHSVTPRGAFRIVHKSDLRRMRGEAWNKYGPCFLQLNVRPEGGRNIGIHGTNRPDSIGKAASSGCIRMRNEDARALYQLVAVGTPVVITE